MLIPALLFFFVFKYVPILGSFIAFKDYNIYEGLWDSEWVGFKWFIQLFTEDRFLRLLWNTLIINMYQIIFAFPVPIIIASLLNEIRMMYYKRTVQTIIYLPHFLSWAIVYGLAFMFLSVDTGLLNNWLNSIGLESVHFLQKAEYFRTIIVTSGIWKSAGWGTIIFLAALAGISPSLYEAARIDGAGRWKQFLHITLPGLTPAIVILFLLEVGNMMELGFEQIWIFLNPMTYSTGDVLDTFNYRAGIVEGNYSFTTAIGIFKSGIGFVLLIIVNRLSKAITGEGIY